MEMWAYRSESVPSVLRPLFEVCTLVQSTIYRSHILLASLWSNDSLDLSIVYCESRFWIAFRRVKVK